MSGRGGRCSAVAVTDKWRQCAGLRSVASVPAVRPADQSTEPAVTSPPGGRRGRRGRVAGGRSGRAPPGSPPTYYAGENRGRATSLEPAVQPPGDAGARSASGASGGAARAAGGTARAAGGCVIPEPMQELMMRHKAYSLSPRDCLKTTLFQK